MSFRNISSWLKSHYDKVIVVTGLMLLAGTLIYLSVRIGTLYREKGKFEQEIRSLKPHHPDSLPLDTRFLDELLTEIEHPFQMPYEQWTNKMVFVPEQRVWCVDCRKPIPYEISKCPFCRTEQPVPVELDKNQDRDGDGMPDWWEIKYGLNPNDPKDADLDKDNDGFTNLEEYRANTDPTDQNSHPPVTVKLRLEEIVTDPFNLKFKSSIKLPDGNLQFGLTFTRRDRTGRLENRTAFVRLGEVLRTAASEIFRIGSYSNIIVAVTNSNTHSIQNIDESVLVLKRGDKTIKLVKERDVEWDECTAHLLFTVDNSRYQGVKIDNVLDLKNEKFKVINIDIKNESVLLESIKDGQRTTIEKFPEKKPEAVKEAVKEPVAYSNAKQESSNPLKEEARKIALDREKLEVAKAIEQDQIKVETTHKQCLGFLKTWDFNKARNVINMPFESGSRFAPADPFAAVSCLNEDSLTTVEGKALGKALSDRYNYLVKLKQFLIQQLNASISFQAGWTQGGKSGNILGASQVGVKLNGETIPWVEVEIEQKQRIIDHCLSINKNPVKTRAEATFAAGILFYELGDITEARKYTKKAITLSPDMSAEVNRLVSVEH